MLLIKGHYLMKKLEIEDIINSINYTYDEID